jgi:hypothetical protein
MSDTIEQVRESWEREGTVSICTRDGEICGVHPFMYTWGVLVGMSRTSYERRYCYGTLSEALGALRDWNGIGHPVGFITMK